MPSKVHITPLTQSTQLPVFDQNGTQVFYVTQDQLQDTAGKTALLHDYNVLGPYMRVEHYICPQQHSCVHGSQCLLVHLLPTLTPEALPHKTVHRSFGEHGYPMHPAGMTAPVYDHTTLKTNNYDSGVMVITSGSAKYFDGKQQQQQSDEVNHQSGLRMQQCSHFQRGMCYQGAECPFLHILHYERQPRHPKKMNPQQQQQQHSHRPFKNHHHHHQQQQQQPAPPPVVLAPIGGQYPQQTMPIQTYGGPYPFPFAAPVNLQHQQQPVFLSSAPSPYPQQQQPIQTPQQVVYIQQPQQQQQQLYTTTIQPTA
eukprot:PhF_6_TR10181/c0_g1_i1/m.15788